MAKYRYKQIEKEALTFEEFIKYGKNNAKHFIGDMPWAFFCYGCPVIYEGQGHYTIQTLHSGKMTISSKHMLMIEDNGEKIYPILIDKFEKTYEEVK